MSKLKSKIVLFCLCVLYVALVARAFVLQNTIDPSIMLSESFAGEVNKAADLILHKGKMPEFKYLLLWAYSKKCPLSSMDTKEAQRIIKLQLKNNDGSLLVLLLSKLRDLLQDKRNQFELAGSAIDNYEKMLDKFYLSMIGQLKV